MMASESRFEPIREGIARQLARRGLGPVAEAARVCAVANQLARGRFEAIRWRGGRLVVVVPNSVAAQELTFLEVEITETLRQNLGWGANRQLRLVIRIQPLAKE